MSSSETKCHYDVLGVARDADASAIKKSHRKLVLKHHPDKNPGDETAAAQFRLVQQAYEVLSDTQERKWYDDHREAILAGWSSGGGDDEGNAAATMLFDVVHFMHSGCYSEYHDETGGFYQVYTDVFEQIVQCELRQIEVTIDLPIKFGATSSEWPQVHQFYQAWESFVSQLNFAWEDKYNVLEDADNRRIRRLMEEENKKARRAAKRTYNQDILALVAFIKRRDPRVKAKQQELEQQKIEQAKRLKEETAERKRENQRAREAWREEAQREMDEAEEADLLAGRVRLADLEDDYDYGGGNKRGKKKKNKRRTQVEEEEAEREEEESADVNLTQEEAAKSSEAQGLDEPGNDEQSGGGHEEEDSVPIEVTESDDNESGKDAVEIFEAVDDTDFSESEEESSEEEPDTWRCECCRKDFKSEGQMQNHMKSKKHKESFKKYEAKMKREEEEIMAQMLDEMAVEDS